MSDVIVCRCINVTENDVSNYYNMNKHDFKPNAMLTDLRIGSRCSCCLNESCPIIDEYWEDTLEKVEGK